MIHGTVKRSPKYKGIHVIYRWHGRAIYQQYDIVAWININSIAHMIFKRNWCAKVWFVPPPPTPQTRMIFMITSPNGNIFRVTGPLSGEFTWSRALMFSSICALNKRLCTQSWGWWFEMPWRSLLRHCNVNSWYHLFLTITMTWKSGIVNEYTAIVYNWPTKYER